MIVLLKDKQATIDYLEFGLLAFVEQFESKLNPDDVGAFYVEAAMLLNDMDETLQIAVDSAAQPQNHAR